MQTKLCDEDSLDEQLHQILNSVDDLSGPIKHLIECSEEGKSLDYSSYFTSKGDGRSSSFSEEGEESDESGDDTNGRGGSSELGGVEFASVAPASRRRLHKMGTPKSDISGAGSPASMEELLAQQGYVTPENQKMESADYSPATSEASESRSEVSREDDSPKIPIDIETEMRRKEMERFMKRVALKHKAMSPETRERIEKNRRNSVMGTGITPRKEVGKSTKDFMNKSPGNKFNTPGSGSGAAFASSKRPDLFKVDVADGATSRHGRRGSVMDILDPGGKSKQGSRGKIRRKSCIDMSKEVVHKGKKKDATKDKGWGLDGKTPPPNRRASISVFKPLS